MQIIKNAVATIHYTVKNDEGEMLESTHSYGGVEAAMPYLHGVGNLISGLESELEGKAAGESISVRVEPKDGYGKKNDALVKTLPRERLEGDGLELEVGSKFLTEGPGGDDLVATIIALTNTDATIDGNHRLAGVALNFDVEVVEVREASEDELSHGYAHTTGGSRETNGIPWRKGF